MNRAVLFYKDDAARGGYERHPVGAVSTFRQREAILGARTLISPRPFQAPLLLG